MSRYEAAFTRLDRYIEMRMQAANTPGMAVALTDREKLLRISTYGYSDIAAQIPVSQATLFEIGSISKSFTSVALMQLREQGLLDLHAPLSRYLPWFDVKSDHVQISHVKLEGYRNWDGIDQLVEILEGAESRGVHLRCDQYPYDAGLSWLAYILPYWAQAGGAMEVAKRLRDPQMRSQLREDWDLNRSQWEERGGMQDWDDLMITACHAQPELQGETVADIALEERKDPLETALDLIVISEGQVECVCFGQLEHNVRTLMQHPLVVVGSDGESLAAYGILSQSGTHPRSYGTFPRVLGHYVREEKVLSLENAVKKMSFDAAGQFGLTNRGVIKEGAWADLVLFDDQTINDLATYTAPHTYPEGIPYVIVNGVIVINQGVHTSALPGKVL